MTRQEFNDEILTPTLNHIDDLVGTKGDEYAVKGAFHNFIQAVKKSRTPSNPIIALEGMQMKHTISIDDLLNKYDIDFGNPHTVVTEEKILTILHKIDEKFDDYLVYTILKKGIIKDFYQKWLIEIQNSNTLI
jgi:hypothetical protein